MADELMKPIANDNRNWKYAEFLTWYPEAFDTMLTSELRKSFLLKVTDSLRNVKELRHMTSFLSNSDDQH